MVTQISDLKKKKKSCLRVMATNPREITGKEIFPPFSLELLK